MFPCLAHMHFTISCEGFPAEDAIFNFAFGFHNGGASLGILFSFYTRYSNFIPSALLLFGNVENPSQAAMCLNVSSTIPQSVGLRKSNPSDTGLLERSPSRLMNDVMRMSKQLLWLFQISFLRGPPRGCRKLFLFEGKLW